MPDHREAGHRATFTSGRRRERREPLEDILTARLTTYHSGTTSAERSIAVLQEILDGVGAGR